MSLQGADFAFFQPAIWSAKRAKISSSGTNGARSKSLDQPQPLISSPIRAKSEGELFSSFVPRSIYFPKIFLLIFLLLFDFLAK